MKIGDETAQQQLDLRERFLNEVLLLQPQEIAMCAPKWKKNDIKMWITNCPESYPHLVWYGQAKNNLEASFQFPAPPEHSMGQSVLLL